MNDANPLPTVNERALTLDEVATILGISRRGVYWMVRDGVLPAFKVRRLLRVLASDVRNHIQANRYTPCPDPRRVNYP